IPAVLIHKTLPHVDILNTGTFGTSAIEFVEVRRVARGASAAKWWQTDPDDRHTLALESSNRVVNAPRVDLFPFLAAKLGRANRFFGTGPTVFIRIGCRRGLLPILFFVLGPRILGRLIFSLLVVCSCISLFGK